MATAAALQALFGRTLQHAGANALARVLETRGFEVTVANSVRDAISIINFAAPDWVITDSTMPDGGGKSVLEFVASSGTNIPVIVLSGDDNDKKRQELLALGTVKVLLKPCDIEELGAFLVDRSRSVEAIGVQINV